MTTSRYGDDAATTYVVFEGKQESPCYMYRLYDNGYSEWYLLEEDEEEGIDYKVPLSNGTPEAAELIELLGYVQQDAETIEGSSRVSGMEIAENLAGQELYVAGSEEYRAAQAKVAAAIDSTRTPFDTGFDSQYVFDLDIRGGKFLTDFMLEYQSWQGELEGTIETEGMSSVSQESFRKTRAFLDAVSYILNNRDTADAVTRVVMEYDKDPESFDPNLKLALFSMINSGKRVDGVDRWLRVVDALGLPGQALQELRGTEVLRTETRWGIESPDMPRADIFDSIAEKIINTSLEEMRNLTDSDELVPLIGVKDMSLDHVSLKNMQAMRETVDAVLSLERNPTSPQEEIYNREVLSELCAGLDFDDGVRTQVERDLEKLLTVPQ